MSAPADAARNLRVHGAARIDGHAGRSHGRLLLEGRVLDDASAPVPSATVVVSVREGDRALDVSGLVSPCGAEQPSGAPLKTDESGRFCLWIAAPVGSYHVHVDAGPTQWLTQASADYAVDLAKRSVRLRFDPEPRVVSIDRRASGQPNTTTLEAVAVSDDDDASGGAAGLPLILATESGAVVAKATTGSGGRATFVFDAHDLGTPGRGALAVRFAGDDATMPSEHVSPIERDAHVSISLAHAVAPSSPEDGVELEVLARAEGGAPSGTIEARLPDAAGGGVLVGAAPLVAGKATLPATFAAPRGAKSAILQLRYVPDAPWLQPAGEISATVPIRGPSPLRQLPIAIGALAIGAWLLLGRNARRHRLDRTVVMTRPPTHEGTAGIAVVHSSRSRVGRYSGRVIDAHDGAPVARARISVQRQSFDGAVLASVFADDAGEFSFELEAAPPDADLVVEAPLHADLRQKLPGAGVLEIALVSRRRRLLERLVQWARRRGPPYDVRGPSPDGPTPAQVRRAAEAAHRAEAGEQVRRWADAVEQAAYDRGDVDARVEADVLALEPAPPAPRQEPPRPSPRERGEGKR